MIARGRSLFIILSLVSLCGGCTVQRRFGTGPALGSYDYCLITEEESHGHIKLAKKIMGDAFTVLDQNAPQLSDSRVRQKTAALSIHWRRGLWSTNVWADLTDLDSQALIVRSEGRSPGLWTVSVETIAEVLRDLAAARKSAVAGPPIAVPAIPNSTLRLYGLKTARVLEGACTPSDAHCWVSLSADQKCEGDFVLEQRSVTRVASSAGSIGGAAAVRVTGATVESIGQAGGVAGASEVDNMNKGVVVLRCATSIIDCALTVNSNSGQGHGECTSTDGATYRLTLIPNPVPK